MERFLRCCVIVSCLLLLLTGAAKIFSAVAGESGILDTVDPVFGIAFTKLMLLAGVLEIMISIVCLKIVSLRKKLFVLAWFSVLLFLYRIDLWSLHFDAHCPCLGNLTDALGIPANVVDSVTIYLLAYLIITNCGGLILGQFHQLKKRTAT